MTALGYLDRMCACQPRLLGHAKGKTGHLAPKGPGGPLEIWLTRHDTMHIRAILTMLHEGCMQSV